MSLTFAPSDNPSGGTMEYEARVAGSMDTRAHKPEGDNPANQCVFLRGYKLTLCRNFVERLLVGRVRISDIVPPKPRNEGGLAGTLGDTLSRWYSWFIGGNREGNQPQCDGPQVPTTSAGTHVVIEGFPDFSEVRFHGFRLTFFIQFISPSCIIRRI
jgi:hypothetical protein